MLTVGIKKKFIFTGPWASSSGQYTLETASSGPAMSAMGVDVFNQLFESNGLGETEYNAWMALDDQAYVYVFNNGKEYVRVPSNYVSIDTGDYVDYQQYFITIGLGYLKTDEITAIENMLDVLDKEIVSVSGIETDIKMASYGNVKPIALADSTDMDTVRTGRIDTLKGSYLNSAESVAEISRLTDLKDKLEEVIKVKITEDL